MTCPQCGAPVQPGDSFCVSCGHALNPADPTRPLENPARATYGAGATVEPAPYAMPAEPPPYQPPVADAPGEGKTWASGSSFPTPNPYAGTPNTVSRGTMLNGRPVGGRGGTGLLKGIGAAVVVLWAVLHQLGHAILAFGVFKLFFLGWIFRSLIYGHLGWLVLVVVIVLIAGAMRRSRTI